MSEPGEVGPVRALAVYLFVCADKVNGNMAYLQYFRTRHEAHIAHIKTLLDAVGVKFASPSTWVTVYRLDIGSPRNKFILAKLHKERGGGETLYVYKNVLDFLLKKEEETNERSSQHRV